MKEFEYDKRRRYANKIIIKIVRLSEKLNDYELANCMEVQARVLISHIAENNKVKSIIKGCVVE